MVLTGLLTVALCAGCFAMRHDRAAFFTLLSIFVILLVLCLLYGPVSIKADADHIILGSILRKRKLLMRDVESVELFQPTMGAVRIFGSGGLMGYWGIFKEGDVGRYSAFYGKASDCFLVRMKNGDKYVLGCENPDAMVGFIKSNLG